MITGKKIADVITGTRAGLAFLLAWMGMAFGPASLSVAVLVMLLDWTGDVLDGFFARRTRPRVHSWLGDHDLEVDILVSIGLMVYMLGAGFLDLWLALGYIGLWVGIALVWGFGRSLGMLFQTPIYAWFIWVALINVPLLGNAILAWIGGVIVLTWPRFPREVIPGFFKGLDQMRNTLHKQD